MTTINLQDENFDNIKIGITQPPNVQLLLEEKKIELSESSSSFPVTILLPKNIKITIPSEPQREIETFYNVKISISLPDDLMIIINPKLEDYRNPVGNIVEKTKDILLGVTGFPFSFHVKEKKYLEFLAPHNRDGVRKFSIRKFDFLEMMEEYNRL